VADFPIRAHDPHLALARRRRRLHMAQPRLQCLEVGRHYPVGHRPRQKIASGTRDEAAELVVRIDRSPGRIELHHPEERLVEQRIQHRRGRPHLARRDAGAVEVAEEHREVPAGRDGMNIIPALKRGIISLEGLAHLPLEREAIAFLKDRAARRGKCRPQVAPLQIGAAQLTPGQVIAEFHRPV
jgi:hypothetical protein